MSASNDLRFCPTLEAHEALIERNKRYEWMNEFKDGPCGKTELNSTESALWAATYELRYLIGSHEAVEDLNNRFTKLWDLLTDGVLRSKASQDTAVKRAMTSTKWRRYIASNSCLGLVRFA